jgi:hypothetical protein
MFVITDTTPDDLLVGPGGDIGGGLELARGDVEYAYGAAASPFPAELLVPDSDVQGIIQEQEERKNGLYHMMRAAQLPAKNQQRTLYCWIFAPTHCIEIVRFLQHQPYVSLSPASAGAYIKNFRNVGGWGLEGLQFISDRGVCPSANWPDTAIDRSYATEENRALALDYRATEWMEAPPRSKRHWLSLVLNRIPVAAGYNRWRHEVTIVGAKWRDGRAIPIIRNQWPRWGDDNFAELEGWGEYPDDIVAPRVAIAA